jgi:nucleotide-binding universal stress UspA family protein
MRDYFLSLFLNTSFSSFDAVLMNLLCGIASKVSYAHEISEREKILAKIKEKAEKINILPKTEVLMYPQNISTAAAIVNYAEKEKVDLITIGTRGRTGITKMLLDSVASAVVTYAHCPVIVVK